MQHCKIEGVQTDLFPAKAGPTIEVTAGPAGCMQNPCRTGFSREDVGCNTAKLVVFTRASSRLKPVPLMDRMHYCKIGGVHTGLFPAKASPTV